MATPETYGAVKGTRYAGGQTLGGRLSGWHGKAIRAFETAFERELDLTECVAICANTKRDVREHYRTETDSEPPF